MAIFSTTSQRRNSCFEASERPGNESHPQVIDDCPVEDLSRMKKDETFPPAL